MTIVLASDHNGVALKAAVKHWLKATAFDSVIDLGPWNDHVKVDYTGYAFQLAQIVSGGDARLGILVCGTGVGMSIAANRVPGARASLVHSVDVAHKTREHNDSNILCLGAWVQPTDVQIAIVRDWVSTPFGFGRHVPRVAKIDEGCCHRVVIANGCFDVLHTGHLALLRHAKALGDRLVVALNSDASVRALKGSSRPVNSEHDRKAVLEAVGLVDEVVVFEGDVSKIIESTAATVIVKGGEWTEDQVRERDHIPPHVAVSICPLVEGQSTTATIARIVNTTAEAQK